MAAAPPLVLRDAGQIDHIADVEDEDDSGMGRPKMLYHQSTKILGKLYSEVDERRIWRESIQQRVNETGPSVWDDLLDHIRSQVAILAPGLDYRHRMGHAWKLRSMFVSVNARSNMVANELCRHESIIEDKRWQFSESSRSAISEVEAFCGFIQNQRGSQTKRQRDSSIKLKDDVDRHMAFMSKQIRDRAAVDHDDNVSEASSVSTVNRALDSALELSWACLIVACIPGASAPEEYHGVAGLASFRIVAACCVLKELDAIKTSAGGGYVGINGGVRLGRGRGIIPLR